MSDFNGYNMPDKGLFGKRCIIPYGMSTQPFVYRLVESGIKSNCWSEVPITAKTMANPVNRRAGKLLLLWRKDGGRR